MGVEWNDISAKSNGGTEFMGHLLEDSLPKELLDQFQIILTRAQNLDADKYRVLWIHDLAEDPSVAHLADGGWQKFHRLVFVSNWQMQRFIDRFQIPWSKCIVMQNAIHPILKPREPREGPVRFVYHTTPHRGLNILLATFEKLIEKHKDNIHLDLFSSFGIYGWQDRDEHFKNLFDFANAHPQITNHMTQPNEVVRDALLKADIFAYPSVWPETSCICLIEAMATGLHCIHSNLGALYETGANWTTMYQYHEDPNEHAKAFYHVVDNAIGLVDNEQIKHRCLSQASYANVFYNWDMRAQYWKVFLENIIANGEKKEISAGDFTYRIGA
jgi:UDP-glucose:(glucosyl)LPS alpha-1,2-glucosyltransferase